MTDSLLSQIAGLIDANTWFAPMLALFAGILTSFTPCCLSSIPLIIGYVGSVGEKNTKNAFLLSVVFSIGSAVTFVLLGIAASAVGQALEHASHLWHILLGVLMILMAFQTWEIFNFIPSSNLMSKNKKKGYIGAFLAGILDGVFSTPCSTPVLVALLTIVAGEGNILWGIFLMLLYSLGNSILALIAGTYTGFAEKLKTNDKYKTAATVSKFIMGAVMLIIGIFLFLHIS